ncbi:hypothetical protein BDY19DRAFT_458721 [Irpex rosettiformis]|uniref:Uncharacterized protein n=1 Tax=Irpex rosettiformis TaxID=378272 RepID=A0ACB8TT78_9APHY|nr:hypothetical protein BDY19DRAFT_458721 [Irpex rosettiformis]
MDQQNEKQKVVDNDSPKKDVAKAKQKSKGKLSAMHKTSGEVKEVKKDEEACETVTSTSCSSTTAHNNQTSSQVPKSEDDATSSLDNKQPQLPAEKAPCKSQSPKSASPPQSSPPLSQPSTWDLFVSRRSQLLQEAIQDSVRTGTFHNVEIYTYRKRGKKSRCAHVPAVIYGRASLLEAASPVLKDLLSSGKTQLNGILSANYDFEYLDDSDFEDEEPEIPESLLTDNSKPSDEISDIASNASTFDLLDSPQPSPRIVAIDEHGEEPPKPPVVESNASTVTKVEPPEPLSREVVYTPFGTTRTWQALMAYLYDGTISFCSLRSSSAQPKMKDGVSCSPKSMYSLAKKLELTDLAKDCENAIVKDLGPSNVVKELFSDFTWRYPEILNREVTVFTKHSQDDRVRSNLKQAFHDMASGKLPRRGIVLSSLFDDILPPVPVASH